MRQHIKPGAWVALLLAALALTACSMLPIQTPSRTPTSTSAPELTVTPVESPTPKEDVVSGTITIWHSWSEARRPALLRRIDAFQQQYPDVQFDVLYVPLIDLRSAYEAAAVEGAGPSLLIGPAEWGPPLYREGWIADLSGMAAPEMLDRMNPAAVQAGTFGESLVGLPLHLEGVVLYRNASIVPTAPDTFEQFITLAERATEGEVVGAILERSFYFSGGHLYGFGGKLLETPSGDPAFFSPTGVAWINLLQSFELVGPTEYFTDADLDLFKAGRVGMIIDSTSNRRSLAESIGGDNLHIDPWPIHENGALSGFIRAENIYLSSPQTNPRLFEDGHVAAWGFLEFLFTAESQSSLAAVGMIPAVNASPDFGLVDQVSAEDRLIREAIMAFDGAAAYPTLPEFEVYPSPMDMALRSVFFQGAEPQAALENAYEAVVQELEERRTTEGQTP